MSKRIRNRWMGVSFLKGIQGPADEGIEYRLAAPPYGGVVPPPARRFVHWQTVEREHDRVRLCAAKLLDAAREGRQRGDTDLEGAIESLAKEVFPDTGLAELFQHDKAAHPLFDAYPPSLADLPWEAFTESFRECENCQMTFPTGQSTAGAPGYCDTCGRPLTWKSRKLGFARHLTHLVHTAKTIVPADGKEFLIIANPTGDLCDVDTPVGRHCRDHVAEIAAQVRGFGFNVELLREAHATAANVLEYLRSPTLVGLYYFGHGYLDDATGEGCLVLHGKSPLFAPEIARARPRCQFVFLNACHGASVGRNWGFSSPLRSVAHSFAAGGDARVVIAPIWPVASKQAALAATDFFHGAIRGARLSHALRLTRRRSYRRYSNGEPDYSWAAYRYFGDPDRTLPTPAEPAPEHGAGIDRVFDLQSRIRTALFSFPIDEILLRAAKRKILQGRSHVSRTDIFAGLIRRGELTRFVFRHLGYDPDHLYETMETIIEVDHAAAATETSTQSAYDFDSWLVRERAGFHEDAIQCFADADRLAQQSGPESVITERHLLEAYLNGSGWNSNQQVKLPEAADVRRIIADVSVRGHIDDNGCLVLTVLESNARQIIDHAHALAQLKGARPIPSRILFIAFFLNDGSYANQLCEARGIDVKGLCAIFLTLTGGYGPETFQLDDHTCSRIITPTLDAAKRIAADTGSLSEKDLFCGFCSAAPDEFKRLLAALPSPWALNLDELCCDDHSKPIVDERASRDTVLDKVPIQPQPDHIAREDFDVEGWRVIELAASWARLQQSQTVRSPHLVAALIGNGSGLVGTMMKQGGIDPELGKIQLLSMVPLSPASTEDTVAISPNVSQVLLQSVKGARDRGKQLAGVQDIADAFFSGDAGAVGEQLRQLGVDTRPWWNEGRSRRHDGNGKPDNP